MGIFGDAAFDVVDSSNVQEIKDLMAQRALDGDAAAAVAYAQLLNAETKRYQLLADTAAVEKAAAPVSTAATWQESVRDGLRPNAPAESLAAA